MLRTVLDALRAWAMQKSNVWAGSLRASRSELKVCRDFFWRHNTEAMDEMPSLTEPNAATGWLRR